MFEFQDYLRAPSSVQLLLELGEQVDIQSAQLLTGTDLSLMQLNDTNSLVKPREEIRVIHNLIELQSPHTAGLGFIAGFKHQITTYGILGFAVMSSATGLEALKLLQRYLALTYTFVKMAFQQENGQYHIYFTEPASMRKELQGFVVERAMAATAKVINELYEGECLPLEEFHITNPEYSHPIVSIPTHCSDIPIQFEQNNNVLKFSTSKLQQPLPHANAHTAAMCERLCLELIAQRQTSLTTSMIVRDFLMNAPNGELLNLKGIAHKLNMSERTFKRRLKQENSTFRQLQNETLHHRAEQLLSQDLSLTQVAEVLGFADLSTFSQAYKRWTGHTPSHFKKNSSHSLTNLHDSSSMQVI